MYQSRNLYLHKQKVLALAISNAAIRVAQRRQKVLAECWSAWLHACGHSQLQTQSKGRPTLTNLPCKLVIIRPIGILKLQGHNEMEL